MVYTIDEGDVYMYIDEGTKWKTSELRQLQTNDLVGMGRKSRQHTIVQYIVKTRLSVHTNWISCMYLPQFPGL